jgi:N-acetyl-anhydromuramyl-L-alanine amidase AmpD
MKIKLIDFPESQYYKEVQNKNQIVLHHTVSDPTSAVGDIGSWLADTSRIATYSILGYDGTLNKCFDSNDWAHHLGIKAEFLKKWQFNDYSSRNELLNRQSIAIEIDAWGGLTKSGDVFLNAYGKPISPKLEVIEVDWRGYHYFQKYSDEQLAALEELLPVLMRANKIENFGIKDGNFGIRRDALQGKSGIFSHSSYREDKSDLYPDERLIKLLNNIIL